MFCDSHKSKVDMQFFLSYEYVQSEWSIAFSIGSNLVENVRVFSVETPQPSC